MIKKLNISVALEDDMVKVDPYAAVRSHFADDTEVEVTSGKGAQGIKYNKKMFAMFYKGGLIIQLSPNRVTELIASGDVQPYDPGTGKPMKDRVLIPLEDQDKWIEFCIESKEYAISR
jgi:hypothetical protein